MQNPKSTSLPEHNDRLHAWLQAEYHQTPHRGIDNLTPLEKWCDSLSQLRQPPSCERLEELFLFKASRKVRKDGTVSRNNRFYEVESVLAGQKIQLRYDPRQPKLPLKVYHQSHPVDLAGNARAKRRETRGKIKFS